MKLFKKVLAIATASALALTLLVGCGKDAGKTTFTVVDYLNDYAAMYGLDVTWKADTALDTNAKNAVTVLQNSGAKTVEELTKKVNGDTNLMAAVVKAVSGGDTKNVYGIGYALTGQSYITDTAKDNAGFTQAAYLADRSKVVYAPESVKVYPEWDTKKEHWQGDIDETKLESTAYVGTATMSLGGKTYLVAVFRTAPKAAK